VLLSFFLPLTKLFLGLTFDLQKNVLNTRLLILVVVFSNFGSILNDLQCVYISGDVQYLETDPRNCRKPQYNTVPENFALNTEFETGRPELLTSPLTPFGTMAPVNFQDFRPTGIDPPDLDQRCPLNSDFN
jgi:hypothetical protein